MNLTINGIDVLKFFLNISSIALFLYILVQDIRLFLSKETYTSSKREKLKPSNFPDIILCPFPAVDLNQLTKHGYRSYNEYFKGNIEDSERGGWCGNSSGPIENVTKDISAMKTVKDCPTMKVKFDHDSYEYLKLKFELSLSVFPNGRCCQSIKPRDSKNYAVKKMYFNVKMNESLPLVEGFQMFLSSLETNHIQKLNKFPKKTLDMPCIM